MASVSLQLNQLEKSQPGGKFAPQILNPHLQHPFLADLCVKDALLDAVEKILGPDIVLISSTLFTKYPAKVSKNIEATADIPDARIAGPSMWVLTRT